MHPLLDTLCREEKDCAPGGLPTSPYYPTHFLRGTHISTSAGGTYASSKLVESLAKEDFAPPAPLSDSSSIVREARVEAIVMLSRAPLGQFCRIEFSRPAVGQRQLAAHEILNTFPVSEARMEENREEEVARLQCPVEYPLFETTKGWCSVNPQKSVNLYGLDCGKLEIGDKCLLLVPAPVQCNYSDL